MITRRKYGNKKIVTTEGEFASKLEYNRWLILKEAAQKGEISDLRKQVEFPLLPAQYRPVVKKLKTKEKVVQKLIERPVTYVADYVYMKDGDIVVEDCKGFPDEKYPIKRKMMLYFHGIQLREVKRATEPI